MWDKIPVSHAGFLVGSLKWTSVLLLLLLLLLNHSSGSAPCITVYAHVFPLQLAIQDLLISAFEPRPIFRINSAED